MAGSSSSGGGSAHWRDGVGAGVHAHAPELTHYLQSTFVPSVVPQQDEYDAKEQARQYLEKLADQVSPGAKLLPFGCVSSLYKRPRRRWLIPSSRPLDCRSMANGFALKNSGALDSCALFSKVCSRADPSSAQTWTCAASSPRMRRCGRPPSWSSCWAG